MPETKTNNKPNKNNTKKFSLRDNIFFVVIVLNIALVTLNLLILYFLPKQTEKIIVTRSEILAQKLQSQSAQKIITDVKAAEKDKQKLNQSLPNKAMLLKVIELIESMMEIVEVESFTFEREEPVEDSQGFFFIPMSVIMRGSLTDTMSALSRLQGSPYLFSVDHTLVESPEGLSQSIKIRTSLRIYVRQPFTENQ